MEEGRRSAEAHATKRQEMQALSGRWQQLREKVNRDEARLHSLRELRDSYEGFAAGVRAVMQAKQGKSGVLKGVIGPAGDLISTEKAYERAIEAARARGVSIPRLGT